MPVQKKAKKNSLKIERENVSGLSSFTERPVPTENEVVNFERVVEMKARHHEIDSNLSEIYRDKKGDLVDVKVMKMKRHKSIIIKIFNRLIISVLTLLVLGFGFYYFFSGDNKMDGLEFSVIAPEKIKIGEEFSYQIKYSNPTKFGMKQINLELSYPESFIYSSSSLTPTTGDYGFVLPELQAGGEGEITVTGKLIAPQNSVQIISGRLSYIAVNFSSEYKKESSDATLMDNLGFQVNVESPSMAFVNQDNDLSVSIFNIDNNYLDDFNLEFVLPMGAKIALGKNDSKATTTPNNASSTLMEIASQGINNWVIKGVKKDAIPEKFNFAYQIRDISTSTEITVRLVKDMNNGKKYTFWESVIKPEMIKSDLNLTLFLNGTKNNNAANFGSTLNYTLSYDNKGEDSFKDTVIMAVLDGAFLDWNTLKSDKAGDVRTGRMIVWTKKELPELAEIKPGDSGEINFSVNLKDYKETDFGKSLEVISYSQYGVNNQESKDDKNKSNVITTKINSDLSLSEQIRYFDENNAPVGSGPLPPRVNEKSSFKVYWTIKNNLHSLSNTEVVYNLPSQVYWEGENSAQVSTGSIYYDSNKHAVIWSVGKLPVSVYQATASFSIALTPNQSDQNKILILSPGSEVSAHDDETQATITYKTEPKTTKLEDDDIAGLNNSGRVE